MAFSFRNYFLAGIALFALLGGVNSFKLQSQKQDGDVVTRTETLDTAGKFVASWTASLDAQIVEISLQVETTGFIGFGISPKGGMTGADIIIGGVFANGTSYFSDRFGIGNQEPVVDDEQNWQLLEATENGTHTFLRMSRLLNTCDDQDVAISEDSTKLIWAIGASDSIEYHLGERGAYSTNMLDAALPPVDISEFDSFDVTVNISMPEKDTTYWCSFHKSPLPKGKRHVVGFLPKLIGSDGIKHTHHFNAYICKAPEGEDPFEFFESWVGRNEECYTGELGTIMRYCSAGLYAWSIGGRIMLFPDYTGFPIAEDEHEYLVLEAHLDNPEERAGVQLETGFTVLHTDKLRQYDAGMMAVGHLTSVALTIPPDTTDYVLAGHCSSGCTSTEIPEEGINFFNVMLHAHISGRKIKLRHFRGDKELPWLSYDNNYDFDYQENRPLRENVKILPGDHLALECSYDSKWKSPPSAVIGGRASRDEMCNSFIFYYPRAKIESCFSGYPDEQILSRFGITEVMPNPGGDPMVISPPEFANMTYTEVLNTKVGWSETVVKDLQAELQFSNHYVYCRGRESKKTIAEMVADRKQQDMVAYPPIEEEYQPPQQCTI